MYASQGDNDDVAGARATERERISRMTIEINNEICFFSFLIGLL